MKLRITLLVIVVAWVAGINGCTKPGNDAPHNPFEDIVRNDTTATEISVDSLTITYLHQKVLAPRCALPGCHVGNFEPDFRTPQSSFSTMVYAYINKNNAAKQYMYRVIPYNKDSSVLYQRITNCCFVNNNDRMPQDNIGVPLPDSSIRVIENWIQNGARDMFGNVAKRPNGEPFLQYYYALDASYQAMSKRLDDVPYNPLEVATSVSTFYIAVAPVDDSTPLANLINNKLKISLKQNDFSQAWEVPAVFVPQGPAWIATINPQLYPANDTLYMRYYVNDGTHAQDTEFPRNDQVEPFKLFWSFIRK